MTLAMPTESITPICGACGKLGKSKPAKSGEPKLPRNWRRFSDKLWCDKCWKANFRIVALTLPITHIKKVDGDGDAWKDFRATMQPIWRDCGAAMTWAVLQLYVADDELRAHHGRKPGEKVKLKPFAGIYLYGSKGGELQPGITDRWPAITPGAVPSLTQRAKKLYDARRWEIFTGRSSLPVWGQHPFPVPDYTLSRSSESGATLMTFRAGDCRWTATLGNRRRFGRQLAAIDKVISGDGLKVEAMISDQSSGGRRGEPQIVAKVVCWLPKLTGSRQQSGTLLVRTDEASFLRARIMGRQRDERWFNEDQVRRWIAEHRRRLQRLSDDEKAERRAGNEPSFQHHRDELTRKQHHRLDTFLHQKANAVAALAERAGVAEVVYDDSFTPFVESFPWFNFWTRLEAQLGARRIRLIKAADKKSEMEAAKDREGWLTMFEEIQKIGKEKQND